MSEHTSGFDQQATAGAEATGTLGVVSARPQRAADIGAQVIAAGGNALDGAAAACIACCMLDVSQTGIGGYVACGVVYDAKAQRVWSIDANAVAPAAAHEHMFKLVAPRPDDAFGLNEAEYTASVVDDANIFGPLAVAPPGVMGGIGVIHEKWGRLPWADVVAPSIALLDEGFPYEKTAEAIERMQRYIRRYPATEKHLIPDGKLPSADDIWHRPDTERALKRVAEAGWRDFYEGEIGRAIADHLQSLGGIVTREDMAAYQPRVTDPLHVRYHDADVYGPILPNGCHSSLQILNMLEALDDRGDDTPESWHRYAEVLKQAWRDRLEYLADPDFVDVPVDRLLSADYAAGRVEAIKRFPDHVDRFTPIAPPDGPNGTLHISVADGDGNLVSMTISHGGAFGSNVTVPGWGIILGHGMCRLDPVPGRANSVQPSKRPLNNTAAMLVRSPSRDVAIGLPGGRRIINVMPRAIQHLVHQHRSERDVATAPRLHIEVQEPVTVTDTMPASIVEGLRAIGHNVELQDRLAGVLQAAAVHHDDGSLRVGSGECVAAC